MKTCPTCGAQFDDSAQFCPNCGYNFNQAAPQGAAPQPAAPQYQQDPNYQQNMQYQQPVQPAYDPYDHTNEFDPADVSENKLFAMLIYLFGLMGVIVALLANHDSPFLKFHIRQGLKLEIASLLLVVLCIIPIIGWIAAGIMTVVLAVIQIICFVRVCKNKSVEPAIVRGIGFLK